jgi:hypothetical protein
MKGTEKQIKWAMDIKEKMIKEVDMEAMTGIIHIIRKNSEKINSINFMNSIKAQLTKDVDENNKLIIKEIINIIENEEIAETLINNQSLYGYMIEYFNK